MSSPSDSLQNLRFSSGSSSSSDSEDDGPELRPSLSIHVENDKCAGAALKWLSYRATHGSNVDIPKEEVPVLEVGISEMHSAYNGKCAEVFTGRVDSAVVAGIKSAAGLEATYEFQKPMSAYADTINGCGNGLYFFSIKGKSGHATAMAVEGETIRFFDSGSEYTIGNTTRESFVDLIRKWVRTDGKKYSDCYLFRISPLMPQGK